MAENAGFGGAFRAGGAADFNLGKAGVGIFRAGTELCECTCKIKRFDALGQKLTVSLRECDSVAAKPYFSAGAAFICKNGGGIHRSADNAVATDNDIGLLRWLIGGTQNQCCAEIVESFFAGGGIFFGSGSDNPDR